jgi:uncharacterized protein YbjT (DUF2867 family)
MTPRTVLVLGGTGKVGRNVVSGLLEAGIAVRALVRTPLRAGLPPGVALHRGDVRDPASVAAAADGTDAAFLLWPGFSADGAAPVVAALARHVRHLVHLSSGVIDPAENRATPGVWAEVEALVAATGVATTFLRPGGFAGNTLMWAPDIRAGRPVRVPYPEARRSLIHEKDIADVAVLALGDPDAHAGRSYPLTGPKILTHRDQAAAIGDAIGHLVVVEAQTRAEAAAEMISGGVDPGWVDSALDHWASLVEHPEVVLDTVERLTGHPARSFGQWAREHAGAFRARPAPEGADR